MLRLHLKSTVAVLALAACSSNGPVDDSSSAPPPNIVLILADDLGYADMSAYPQGRLSTPNIDRIGNGSRPHEHLVYGSAHLGGLQVAQLRANEETLQERS